MQIQLISQFTCEGKEFFKTSNLKTRWDQLVMVGEGSYLFLVGAEEKPYTVEKNEIIFIPAGTQINRSIPTPVSYYQMSFIAQADHPFRLALRTGKLKLPLEQRTSIFNRTKRAFLIPNNQELLEHMIEHVLSEHYLFGKTDRVNHRPLSEEVESTIRYMNRHLQEKIDVDELAARVYLSHTGLIWKFRQELNTTPSKYLILLRLRYAKQLLLDHDYPISEIAERCGYVNPYYFTNAFHQYTGKSPSEFRKYYSDEFGGK